jgi:hypothetical protein
MPDDSSPMPRFFALFLFFLATAGLLSCSGYLALAAVFGETSVFGALHRMPLYHQRHPFDYIALVVVIYALTATLGVLWWPASRGWKKAFLILGIMFMTLAVACAPGGILWAIHDMQAGFVPSGDRFWKDFFQGAMWGLQAGWRVIVSSIPYNLFGLILGYLVTSYGFKVGRRDQASGQGKSL